jgi:hypothetical protein
MSSVKAIVKKYQHTVNGVTVGNREAARVMQRTLRQEALEKHGVVPKHVIDETKIVQRVLIERYVR